MSDEAAFLRAIQDQPNDSLVRLVYADWLEERGDDRHRLIRVEEAMRPHKIWSDEFQRLKPERNHLRKQFAGDWLDAMGYTPIHRPMFGEMPPTAEGRWRLAEEFIDIWRGGLRPGDGYTDEELDVTEARLGVPLPKALREWYRLAGRRRDIWSAISEIVLPEHLRLPRTWRDTPIEWGLEIQNEVPAGRGWFIRCDDLHLPDPPVRLEDSIDIAASTVSELPLVVLLCEVRSQVCCEIFRSRSSPTAVDGQSGGLAPRLL